MKKVIIVGLSDLAQLLVFHLEKEANYEICALSVEKEFVKSSFFMGSRQYPIIPFENIEDSYSPSDFSVFICIGYTKMNEIRERFYNTVKQKGYIIESYIHSTSVVYADTLGEGNLVFENVTIGPFVNAGICNIFYPCSHIAHHTTIGNFNFFAISSSIAGHVNIENNCFFGNNCTTKNGITVSNKTLVGAGAYLSKNTCEGDVWVPERSSVLSDKTSTDICL